MKRKGIPKPYFEWVKDYWYSRGKHLDFERHAYLKTIYEDQEGTGDGIIIYQKSAQVGLTERMVTEALWFPDQNYYNSIYFFPTSGNLGDLVRERIDQPINSSPYLQEVSGRAKNSLGKGSDTLGLKKMTMGFCYLRGSNSLPGIISIAGDCIFVDEVDRMMAENIPYFEKRLEHSSLKHQRWASTPTLTDFGINKLFKDTDQTTYLLKCNHCNEIQELDFWQNVDIEGKRMLCSKCKKEIIPYELKGEWVAKYRDKDTRGYHISSLYSPMLDINKLIKASKKTSEAEIQQFYNQNLGITYESSGARITLNEIENCKGDYKLGEKPQGESLFLGVDVGSRLHYVIRSKDKIIEMSDVSSFSELSNIMQMYNIKGAVIDALPETRKVQEFALKHPKRVKMCYYTGLVEMKDVSKYWSVTNDKVNTERTVALDMIFSEFKTASVKIPSNYDGRPEFVAHIKSTTRIIDESKTGTVKAVYVKTSDDHLLHACNYAKLAVNIYDVTTPEVFIM